MKKGGLQTLGKTVLTLTGMMFILIDSVLTMLGNFNAGMFAVIGAIAMLVYVIAAWQLGWRDQTGDNYRTFSNLVTCLYGTLIPISLIANYMFNVKLVDGGVLLFVGALIVMIIGFEFHDAVRNVFRARSKQQIELEAKAERVEAAVAEALNG